MGIASLGGILSGAGNVNAPNVKGVGQDYLRMLTSYLSGQGDVFKNEQTLLPQYAGLMSDVMAGQLPALSGILNRMNPAQSNLMAQQNQTAREGLDAGAALDPALASVVQQSMRGGQAARGLGYGPGDTVMESSALAELANQLRQQRQAYASNVAQQNNAFVSQPLLAMLAGARSAGPGVTGAPGSTLSLLTMPYQGRLQASMGTATNNTGLYQSMDANSTKFAASAVNAA